MTPKNNIYLFFPGALLLFSCSISATEKPRVKSNGPVVTIEPLPTDNNFFGHYGYSLETEYETLILHKDSTYLYKSGTDMFRTRDSGTFNVRNSLLFLTPYEPLPNSSDYSRSDIPKRIRVSPDTLYIESDRLIPGGSDYKSYGRFFLKGSGRFSRLYNSHKLLAWFGTYAHNELHTGYEFKYTNEDLLDTVFERKAGIIIDTILYK